MMLPAEASACGKYGTLIFIIVLLEIYMEGVDLEYN
jgi:hypothetical protein